MSLASARACAPCGGNFGLNLRQSEPPDEFDVQQRIEGRFSIPSRQDVEGSLVPGAAAVVPQEELNPDRPVHRDHTANDIQGPFADVREVIADAVRGNKARLGVGQDAQSRARVAHAEEEHGLVEARVVGAEEGVIVDVFGVVLVIGDQLGIV
jgi:hypothetical protein